MVSVGWPSKSISNPQEHDVKDTHVRHGRPRFKSLVFRSNRFELEFPVLVGFTQ